MAPLVVAISWDDAWFDLSDLLGALWPSNSWGNFANHCSNSCLQLAKIRLRNDWLYVGNAKIEIKYIKKVVLLEKDQFLKIRGAQADPAAFNATRFWVTTGVKVEIKDRKDPTPYWLISSRKAKYLSKALN